MTLLPVTQPRNVADPPAFDPLGPVFIAQDSRPAAVESVDVASLEPYQRALLAIDGTVTQFMEAWWLEPVEVLRLEQEEFGLGQPDPWLGLDPGSSVVRRRVLLRGRRSGRLHAWADSLIAAGRIGPGMRRALDRDGGGIGRILIDAGVESRREALWYGRESPGDVPAEVAAHCQGPFLSRSYRLLVDGRPVMLITERFPP